jgi:hypothetical protein
MNSASQGRNLTRSAKVQCGETHVETLACLFLVVVSANDV